MAKKKKKLFTLLSLCVVMVLVIGLYFIIPKGDDDNAEEEPETTETIEVNTLESDSVSGIDVVYGDVSYVLEKKGDNWKLKEDESILLNSESVDAMLKALNPIEASKEITFEEEQKDAYGLIKPSLTVKISMSDGAVHQYDLGESVPVVGGYYGQENGSEEKLYAISDAFYNAFAVDKLSLYQADTAPEINASYVSAVSVDNRKGNDFSAMEVEEDEQVDKYSTWNVAKPYSDVVAANAEQISPLQTMFATFNITDMVEYKAKDFAKYGLDKPQATVSVDYFTLKDGAEEKTKKNANGQEVTYVEKSDRNNKSFSLYIGDKADDEDYYVRMKGSDGVYKMPVEAAEKYMDIQAFEYVDHCVYSVLATDLKGFDVTVGGKTIKVTRKEVKAEKSEDSETASASPAASGDSTTEEKDDTKNEWYVNGKKVPAEKEEDFLKPYSAMYLIEFSNTIKDSVKPKSNKPFLTVVYHTDQGDDTVKYLPYDGTNFYRVEKNGSAIFVTDKRAVDDLEDRFLGWLDLVK